MSDILRFELNQPVTIALQSTFYLEWRGGKYGPQHLYLTVEHERLYASLELSRKIQDLKVNPGEAFCIRKWKKGRSVRYDVWLAIETEKFRAAMEAPQVEAELHKPPSSSLIAMPNPQPERVLAPTGTEGPSRMPAPRSVAIPQRRAEVIPFNVAFREVARFVAEELKTAGQEWNDAARQDAVSTVIIAAANRGWIGLWERGKDNAE